MAQQLTFDLPTHAAQGLDDFLVTPSNMAAMATIEAWENWPNRKLVLAGPHGTGKTHMAHVWAKLANARIFAATTLDQIDIEAAAGQNIVIEDLQDLAQNPALETALFHLHNLVLAEGGTLLMTSTSAPTRLPLTLPDLKSRLEATTLAQLDLPDDMLLTAVLVKLFDDRQVAVSTNLVDYLVPRMERSLSSVAQMVTRLDQLALAERRPVTRALAARLLDKNNDTP